MGTKRVGLARTQALIENLKRELAMGGSDLTVGNLVARGTGGVIKYQGAPATTADSTAAITAANILTGIVQCTPTTARSKATDTAANLVSGLGLTADGDSFDFSFINIATTADRIVTVTAGTGVTLVGAMTLDPYVAGEDTSGSHLLRVRRTGATAVTIYRLA